MAIELDAPKFMVSKLFEGDLLSSKSDVIRMLRILDTHGKGSWYKKIPEKNGDLIIEELTGLFVSSESVVDVSIKFEFSCENGKNMIFKKVEFVLSMKLVEEIKTRKINKGRRGDWCSSVTVINGDDALWGMISRFLKEHGKL